MSNLIWIPVEKAGLIMQPLTNQVLRVSQLGSTSGADNLDKMAKNCMKMTKSAFLGQNSGGGHGGDRPIFRVVGGIPRSPPPLGETLVLVLRMFIEMCMRVYVERHPIYKEREYKPMEEDQIITVWTVVYLKHHKANQQLAVV